MAKKSKEKKNNSSPGLNTSSNANSRSIFTTLFGNAPEDADAASIFSDANQFRRKGEDDSQKSPSKPNQKVPGFVVSSIEKRPKIDSLNVESNSEEQKNRKKGKDKSKRSGNDSEADAVERSKKPKKDVSNSKKMKGKNQNLQLDSGDVRKPDPIESLDPVLNTEVTKKIQEQIINKDLVSEGIIKKGKEKSRELGVGTEKQRKKRKRDEIEVEYEKKLYGAVAAEENETGGVTVGEKRKKRENPEELMVSKEGFDDEDKLLRTVFVGNLPLKIKKKVLLKEFGTFGEVESIRIRSVPLLDSKTPRKGAIMKKQINESADSVHAYIVFKTVESAQGALSHNMAVIGENHIRVDRACPPRKKLKGDSTPLYDNKRTIFVGNLPFDVKDEELYQLFTHMKGLESSLEAVRVIRDPNSSLGKGIAYVLFETKEAANMVVRKRDLRLRDRELRVSHVKLNSTPKKIQSVSPGKGVISSKRRFVESASPGSNMSYQGLRASKSGVSKKTSTNTGRRVNLSASKPKAKEPIDRKRKRPAVAARKAKALKSDLALKTSGAKRKLGNRTPDSAYQKKKARKNQ